jgi:ribose 5-phosphate isomerase B
LKEDLAARFRAAGHEVVDFNGYKLEPADDYPDFVAPLAHAVAAGTVERGVGVCGRGIGASICANKVRGVRASLVEEHLSARQGVEYEQQCQLFPARSILANHSLTPTDPCSSMPLS